MENFKRKLDVTKLFVCLVTAYWFVERQIEHVESIVSA